MLMVMCCLSPAPQEKDALPKGDLNTVYPRGVLFVTYSLLVGKAKMASSGRLGDAAKEVRTKMRDMAAQSQAQEVRQGGTLGGRDERGLERLCGRGCRWWGHKGTRA
jgi:hypothetical protein